MLEKVVGIILSKEIDGTNGRIGFIARAHCTPWIGV